MHPARSYKKANQDFEHEQQKSSLKQIGTPSMSCNLLYILYCKPGTHHATYIPLSWRKLNISIPTYL